MIWLVLHFSVVNSFTKHDHVRVVLKRESYSWFWVQKKSCSLKQLRHVDCSLRKFVNLDCDLFFVLVTANTECEPSFLELAGSSSGVQLHSTTQGEHALGTWITNEGITCHLWPFRREQYFILVQNTSSRIDVAFTFGMATSNCFTWNSLDTRAILDCLATRALHTPNSALIHGP